MSPRALPLVRVATTFAVTLALAGCVARPMTVAASYPSHVPSQAAKPVACRMRVVAVGDERMDPTVLGVVAGRTVHAPGDAQAWIRSVFAGLQESGIKVEFAESDSQAPGTFNTRVSLRSAWASTDDELQGMLNRAFDQALEQIATDFRSLCLRGP